MHAADDDGVIGRQASAGTGSASDSASSDGPRWVSPKQPFASDRKWPDFDSRRATQTRRWRFSGLMTDVLSRQQTDEESAHPMGTAGAGRMTGPPSCLRKKSAALARAVNFPNRS